MKKTIRNSPVLRITIYILAYLIGTFLIEFGTNDQLFNQTLNLIGMLIIGIPFWWLSEN